jgi:hypothetical protein
MATLTKSVDNNSMFDNILPTYGNPRVHVPVWDEGQKMFLCDEYVSNSGNRYYKGIRFCDRIAIVENNGIYHSCTYIDSLEVYAFNGTRLELVQKREYKKTFRNEDFIRSESEAMLRDYLSGILKTQHISVPEEQLNEQAKSIVGGCYKSFLADDFNTQLIQILPQIEQK